MVHVTNMCTTLVQLNMLDLKQLKGALEQLEEERKIPKEKIVDAIEQSLAAAYKKDYGKKGQIVRSKLDLDTGESEFYQVKIVVDDSTVRFVELDEEGKTISAEVDEDDLRSVYNPEKHILLEDAKLLKSDAEIEDEVVFPLETKEDFGRIAAQTAKQVIIQRIREAERGAVLDEFEDREGEIVSGTVQKIDRGNIIIDFGRASGMLHRDEQIPGEKFSQGQRIKTYLFQVEEGNRGVNLKLSRSHPRYLLELFAIEAPEIANGIVEVKSIAREPGARSKIAVMSHDEDIDPIGSCVGQKGVRVTTVMNELNGEKIDIILWSEDHAEYIAAALSPAKVLGITIDEGEHTANVEVAEDQLSLAIGKGGQNVRLAAKLTGWKIDIKGMAGEVVEGEEDEVSDSKDEEYTSLKDLKSTVKESEGEVSEDKAETEEAAEEATESEKKEEE